MACALGLVTACSGSYSVLDPGGPAARRVAGLWWGMSAFAALVLIVVTALWLYAIRRNPGAGGDAGTDIRPAARNDPQQEEEDADEHRPWLIGGGIVLPSVSILVLLLFGIPTGHRMLPPGADGDVVRIDVTGRQWWWEVSYPSEGVRLENELHIPAGQPVHIHLTATDVIHSFWVPRLAGKLDAIPGRTNVLLLQADEPGTYLGHCAEFCGLQHAHMQFTVHAHTPAAFAQWLQENRADD